MNSKLKYWDSAIILIDMNAFFASIEQLDNPQLRGKPIAVTNGDQGTCIITCSYEARKYGIKTGMRVPEALQLCPHLIRCPTHPRRYAQISTDIMTALQDITPDIEVFSVDEAFLDVTHCQKLWGSPEVIGRKVKQLVYKTSKLLCSIGVSGDKTTAKYAAKKYKPDGFCVIPPWQAKQALKNADIDELCGVGQGLKKFLAQYGVYKCGDMEKIPISVLAQRFGNPGRRLWYMAQGADPEPVKTTVAPPKSMGHGKVLPPRTCDCQIILTYLLHMCEKLARRLRRHNLRAKTFYVGVRSYTLGWLGNKEKLNLSTNDGQIIFKLTRKLLLEQWNNQPVMQIQVTALDPDNQSDQLDMFAEQPDELREQLLDAIENIDERFGHLAIAPARLLNKTKMNDVIAPAWKPTGPRKTI